MQPFDYAAPSSVDDALALLARHGADAKVLAGGQSLLPILNYRLARPRLVVDVNALPLDSIAVADGPITSGAPNGPRYPQRSAGAGEPDARLDYAIHSLRLGALTRHATLMASPVVARECPLLAEAAALVGNVRVRTLGTLGGSLAHADPAAELPLAIVTLDATLEMHSARGARTIAARDFFTGYLTTALAADELLTAIDVPVTRGMGSAIEEFSRRPGDFALVAVAALIRIDARGRVEDVRVGLGGVGPGPVRVAAVEDALRGQEPTADWIARAGEIARAAVDPAEDAFASAGYRKLLAGVLTKRALTRAVARAMEVPA